MCGVLGQKHQHGQVHYWDTGENTLAPWQLTYGDVSRLFVSAGGGVLLFAAGARVGACACARMTCVVCVETISVLYTPITGQVRLYISISVSELLLFNDSIRSLNSRFEYLFFANFIQLSMMMSLCRNCSSDCSLLDTPRLPTPCLHPTGGRICRLNMLLKSRCSSMTLQVHT